MSMKTTEQKASPLGRLEGLEIFREYLTIKGHTIKTREGIIKTVERFALWCEQENLELENIIYNDVTAYISYRRKQGNIKPISLQKIIGNLKHYYNFLISREEVIDNPCSNITIKGVKRKNLYETFTSEELEKIYQTFAASPVSKAMGGHLIQKRNKAMLALVIYQGLRTEELARLKTGDLKMREGKIFINGSRRTNEREMNLEAHQLYDLMDYVNETRKLILMLSGKTTDSFFTSLGCSERFDNILPNLINQLKKQNPKIRDIKQLRASVISNWLKIHGLRKVQHLAGHRYVSSTEAYKSNNMEGLIDDINTFHPDL